jgi:hypothetical protein
MSAVNSMASRTQRLCLCNRGGVNLTGTFLLLNRTPKIFMTPKTQEILDELEAWCDDQNTGGNVEHRGESLVGKVIDTSPEEITNWFGGEQQPTPAQLLLVQEFLSKQRNWEKSA